MAEHILRRLLLRHAVPEGAVIVTSGGIAPYARDGSLVSLDTRLALRDVDIHIDPDSGARDLKRGHRHLLETADLVLAMTEEQVAMVRSSGAVRDGTPILTLRELAGLGGDIADPAGQDESVFNATRDAVAHALDHALPRLLPSVAEPPRESCPGCSREPRED
jgi:protein-tyrosine-phosphatase